MFDLINPKMTQLQVLLQRALLSLFLPTKQNEYVSECPASSECGEAAEGTGFSLVPQS